MRTSAWISKLVVLVAGVACGDPAECPEGRRKLGSRCEVLMQDAGAVTAMDAEDAGQGSADSKDPVVADPMADAERQTCLVDLDGDGFGVEQVGAACLDASRTIEPGDCDDSDPDIHPLAADACGDGRDNDCDGETDETTAEVCNGLDDDCDGVLENGFACAAGAELACTTSCGTQGTTTCNEACEEPGVEACTPPAEVCNWVDEDCDGVVDQGLLVAKGPALLTSLYGVLRQVALLRREKGQGAWLVTTNNYTSPSASGAVRIRGVSASGQLQSEEELVISGVFDFRAALEGKWLALLVTTNTDATGNPLPSDARGLDVILLDSDTLEVKSRQQLGKTSQACDSIWPSDIAVMETRGKVYLAILFDRTWGTLQSSGLCEIDPDGSWGSTFGVLRYEDGSSLSQRFVKYLTRTPGGRLFSGPATFDSVERVPCREEWLVRHGPAEGKQVLTKFALEGDLTEELHSYDATTDASEFYFGEVDCTAPHTSLLLARMDAQTKSSHLEHFELRHADGRLRSLDKQSRVDGRVLQAAQLGGRWFTAGINAEQLATPLLHEVTLQQPEGQPIALAKAFPSISSSVVARGARLLALTAVDEAVSFAVAQGANEADKAHAYVLDCP